MIFTVLLLEEVWSVKNVGAKCSFGTLSSSIYLLIPSRHIEWQFLEQKNQISLEFLVLASEDPMRQGHPEHQLCRYRSWVCSYKLRQAVGEKCMQIHVNSIFNGIIFCWLGFFFLFKDFKSINSSLMYCEMVEPAIPWVFRKILSLLEDGVLTKVLYKRNHFVRACPPHYTPADFSYVWNCFCIFCLDSHFLWFLVSRSL